MGKISQEVFESAVQAVINGRITELETLLSIHPMLAKERFVESKGQPTLLHFVAANGVENRYQKTPPNIEQVAQILLDHGADPSATADFYGGGAGSTALVGLVSSVHPFQLGKQEKLIELFVEAGAPVDGILDDGMPLATALAFWYPGAAKKLIEMGASLDNLVFAAASGDWPLIQSWLADNNVLGPKVYPDPFARELSIEVVKNTAFVKACLCSEMETVTYLLENGFDINGKTINGQTGLHEASYRGSLPMVKYLVQQGAEQSRDRQFNSLPIHWAKAGHQVQIFEYLLSRSELELADYAEFGMIDEVRKILNKDPARVNEQNGWPLREAVAARQVAMVEYLLAQGADPTLKDDQGRNALAIAEEKGYDKIESLLEHALK